MSIDEFAERLAGLRQRFAAKLGARIAEIDAAIPELSGADVNVGKRVYEAHRHVHDLCGAGPTLGFIATGKAARVCERILLEPSRTERGLTDQEIANLRQGLEELRSAAAVDMQSSGTE